VVMRTAPAVEEAVRHLASLGHVDLAYLGGPRASWAAGERRDAVRRTAKATGLAVTEIDIGAPTFEAAAEVVDTVVASGATAVLAFNGQMALGVIAGLARRGIAVPAEISVIGGDDGPMAPMTAPPLTAISLPTDEAGTAAVALLQEPEGRVELFGTFVARGSTGPVTH
jgi:DNA-binding LacI/PurR family transcriptional regulator